MTFTDGVKYMADKSGAYWLIDEIALTNITHEPVHREEFQVWILKRDSEGSGATLTCEDGDYNAVYSKYIEFTDFPLAEIKLYCENGVIYLPTER